MAPKKKAKVDTVPEESLNVLRQVACLQMNISDVYYLSSCYYRDDLTVTGMGAYMLDQAEVKWFHARKSLKYIADRDNKGCLPDIQRPEIENPECVDYVMVALDMEKELTKVLQNLHTLAFNIGDTDTLHLVREFISRQKSIEDHLVKEITKLTEQAGHAQKEKEKECEEEEACLFPDMDAAKNV